MNTAFLSLNDLITIGIFTLLLCVACSAMAYHVGAMHGRERGQLEGEITQRRTTKTTVIRAKREAFKLGVVTTLSRMLHGERIPSQK